MTREEAIEVLKKNRPCADPRRCGLELCTAVDVAIAALREQEERSRGCGWCESLNKKTEDFKCGDVLARGVVEHTFWGDGRWHTQEPKFCPMYGRRLEEV